MPFFIAVLVFVVVTLAVFAGMSLFDQRKAQARVLRDRLSTVQKPAEQPTPDARFYPRRSPQPDSRLRYLAAPLGARLSPAENAGAGRRQCSRREIS